ncbi:MAG: hypothetical protein V7K50_24060 [Nostoc sp.]|uniref:hypothetical protein n=1 Tax=Nostoc sp. TaxID=1180 RepID=UPI002FF57B12
MQQRCDLNRKRSKRRKINCSIDGSYLDSVSQKYLLFADLSVQLQQRGVSRKTALLLLSKKSTVPLKDEWLEAFWCKICNKTQWYHVRKTGKQTYDLSIAQQEMWQQVQGVVNPDGNQSVSEFTRRQSRTLGSLAIKDFNFIK